MAPCPINPALPIFSQALPTFATHIFHHGIFIQMYQFCALHWARKLYFSVCQKCSVTKNMSKMRYRPGLSPGPRWGRSRWPHSRQSLPDPTPLSAFSASILAPSPLAPRRFQVLRSPRLQRSPLVPQPKSRARPRCFKAGYGPRQTSLELELHNSAVSMTWSN